ncbi:hypothetical protein [Holzapfeliella sp. JNUCC 80]
MDKTIREISEDLDVSKQSINRYINKQKDFKKNCVTTKDRTNYVNEDGQKELKEYFEQSLQVKIKKQDKQHDDSVSTTYHQPDDSVSTHSRKPDDNVPTDSQQLIDTLKKELENRNEELKQRSYEIQNMQKLVDQQQRLSLQSNSSIAELKEELKKEREAKEKLLEQPKEFDDSVSTVRQQTDDNAPADLQQADDDKQKNSSQSKSWWKFWK